MKRAGFLLCFGVLIAGCSPIYYAPNSLNVPMIGKKGEGMIAAQFGDNSSLDVEAAYSPA